MADIGRARRAVTQIERVPNRNDKAHHKREDEGRDHAVARPLKDIMDLGRVCERGQGVFPMAFHAVGRQRHPHMIRRLHPCAERGGGEFLRPQRGFHVHEPGLRDDFCQANKVDKQQTELHGDA